MKHARTGAFAAIIVCAISISGCSTLDKIIGADEWKEWTPSSNCIQVHADGSLTETIFDTLDQSWYQGNELQDMIARSMNEYNASHEDGSIAVTSYSDAGGEVRVSIDYKTDDDFAEYNNAVFCCGSMLDAQMKGFLFSVPFYAVDGSGLSGDALDAAEPLSHKEYSVVISDGSHVIQVPGEIRYVSGGAGLINSHVAQVADPAQIADTSDAALYVIYEKDQEPAVQKLQAQ